MTSPFDTPQLHDRLVLIADGQRFEMPGAHRIRVRRQPREDAVSAPGEDGEVVENYGDGTAEVTVSVQIWEHEQYRAMIPLLRVLRVRSGEEPGTYEVVHPKLQAHGIRRLRLTNLEDDPYTAKDGGSYTFSFAEFYKPKKDEVVEQEGGGGPIGENPEINAALGVNQPAAQDGTPAPGMPSQPPGRNATVAR